ncbi:hypothetical protein GYMLUDRAFT_56020 [Collybiopsis luxurians FD-317 M1]|nr:hypothetical protein GYMLUDRAFT_56020 [Collybiopsis luxurians FD-317 M1]
MWINLQENNLLYSDISAECQEGTVNCQIIDELCKCISELQTIVYQVYPSLPDDWKILVKENGKIVDICFTQIRDVTTLLCDQQQGLVELQWAFLTIQAVLDYHCKVCCDDSPNLIHQQVVADSSKMGAFIYNDTDAQFLYSNGFPVYYVCNYQVFNHQVILEVVQLQRALLPAVHTSPTNPLYNPIATTQAGSDIKFAAI